MVAADHSTPKFGSIGSPPSSPLLSAKVAPWAVHTRSIFGALIAFCGNEWGRNREKRAYIVGRWQSEQKTGRCVYGDEYGILWCMEIYLPIHPSIHPSIHLYLSTKHKNTIWQSHTADTTVRLQWYWTLPFRLRNDPYCVEWGVKLYSLTHSTLPYIHKDDKKNKNRPRPDEKWTITIAYTWNKNRLKIDHVR